MASNITKNFKAKAGLRMATGGLIDPIQTEIQQGVQKAQVNQGVQQHLAQNAYGDNQLNRGAAFQFGTIDPSGLGRGANASFSPSALPTSSTPYTPGGVGDPHAAGASFAPTRTGLPTQRRLQEPLQQPSRTQPSPVFSPNLTPGVKGLRAGGTVMPVKGKGTGTSDDVPVVLAGKRVDVSDGEGVAVIPAKSMQRGASEAIEEIIEATNGKPVNRGLREGLHDGGQYFGGYVDDFGNVTNKENLMKNPVRQTIYNQQMAGASVDAQPYAQRPDVQQTARTVRPDFIASEQSVRANPQPRNLPVPVAQSAPQPGTSLVPSQVQTIESTATRVPSAGEGFYEKMGKQSADDLARVQRAETTAAEASAAATKKPGIVRRGLGLVGDVAKPALPIMASMETGRDPLHVDDAAEGSGEGLSNAFKKAGVAGADVGTKALDIASFGLLDTNKSYRDWVTKKDGVRMATPQERAESTDGYWVPSVKAESSAAQPIAPANTNDTNREEMMREDRLSEINNQYDPQERAVNSSWDLRSSLQNARGGTTGMGAMDGSIRALAGNEGLRQQFNENQKLTAAVPGNSGTINASTDANGRLVLSGKDVKGSAGLSGYDMKKDNESMAAANAIRQSMIDGQRTDIDQGVFKATGNAGLAQAVQSGKLTGRDAVAMHQQELQSNAANSLRGQMVGEQARHNKATEDFQNNQLLIQDQRYKTEAQKKEAEDRFTHSQQIIKASGIPDTEANAFLSFINANYVGGERDPNTGVFKKRPGEDFESLTKAQQAKMLPGLIANYALRKKANEWAINGSDTRAFEVDHAATKARPKLELDDVATDPDAFMIPWKFSSDDPKEMTMGKFLERKYSPWGGSDDMITAKGGQRVLRTKVGQELLDENGNVLRGSREARAGLREGQK